MNGRYTKRNTLLFIGFLLLGGLLYLLTLLNAGSRYASFDILQSRCNNGDADGIRNVPVFLGSEDNVRIFAGKTHDIV